MGAGMTQPAPLPSLLLGDPGGHLVRG